jgi:hypothetical protein
MILYFTAKCAAGHKSCEECLIANNITLHYYKEKGSGMEAVEFSEMLVNLPQCTWQYNPEDSHFRSQCYGNLKSYKINTCFFNTSSPSSVVKMIVLI